MLALLISAVIISLYATYFSGRINTLRLAMSRVSNNNYDIVDTIRGDDELTATFRDMKVMVEKLKSAEAEIYQAQIRQQTIENQQQQMELKLLANQINPHFLYNTLESIRMKAFIEGNRDVATAIKLLSKSMRYVLSNTRTTSTTLEKELDYINTYMAIMKLRFSSRIDYDIYIEEGLAHSGHRILPLLLQPIIENAISHGLRDMEENGHIILKIRTSKDGALLHAHIFDNGAGMSKDTLKHVNAHLSTPRRRIQSTASDFIISTTASTSFTGRNTALPSRARKALEPACRLLYRCAAQCRGSPRILSKPAKHPSRIFVIQRRKKNERIYC